MKRLFILPWALLLLTVNGSAATAYTIVHWGDLDPGIVSTNNNTLATHGTFYMWTMCSGASYTRWWITNGLPEYKFKNPYIVDGTSYDGSSANWLYNDVDQGTADDFMCLRLADPSFSLSNVMLGGFMRLNITNTGLAINLDLMDLASAGGGGSMAMQWRGESSAYILRSHSTLAGVSQFGPGFTVENGVMYFIVIWRDNINGKGHVKAYNVDNAWSLVGDDQSDLNAGDTNLNRTFLVEWLSGYLGDPPGYLLMGDMIFKTDATQADYDAILGDVRQSISATSARFGSLRGR